MATPSFNLGYRSSCDYAGVEVPHRSLEMFTDRLESFHFSHAASRIAQRATRRSLAISNRLYNGQTSASASEPQRVSL